MSPTKAVQQFKAWSYSRLTDYEACPFRAKLKHLDKIPEPPAPALERGSQIHKLAEGYVRGLYKELPKELGCFAEEFKELLSHKETVQVELQIGLDAKWQPGEWFGPSAWCRIVVDCMYDQDTTRTVIDHKTGKINPKHMDQLSLYAIAAFATAPDHIKRVDTKLWYLDAGEERGRAYLAGDIAALKKTWAKRVKKMLADTTFKPTPSTEACRWCPFSKAKGGQCDKA